MPPGAAPAAPDVAADAQPAAAACTAAAAASGHAPKGDGGGSGCCGAARGTAFRAAEKKYQLHLDQQINTRNGRRHGGRLVPRPTDMSGVLDLHGPVAADTLPSGVHLAWWSSPPCSSSSSSCGGGGGGGDSGSCGGGAGGGGGDNGGCGVESGSCVGSSSGVVEHGGASSQACLQDSKYPQQQQHHQHHHQQQQQQQQQQHEKEEQQQERRRAFLFDRHPGLVYFPSALLPDQQAHLIESAVLSWPDPPARSNHTAAYPAGLPRLFVAARAGLRSAVEPRPETDEAGGGVYGGGGGGGGSGGGGRQEEQGGQQQHAEISRQQEQQQNKQQQEQEQEEEEQGQKVQQQQDTQIQQPAQQAAAAAWAPGGAGPPAADLLRRLRWVTLGPAFNWTARVYEPWEPHTPLPRELRGMAITFEARAAALLAAGGSGVEGAVGGVAADAGGAAGEQAAAAVGEGQQQQQQQQQRPYTPDAALVNYYRPGDTLGGHIDDAEKDMAAPIVTASLGAAAIFLIGGTTRDVAPTPLLLRSGDVVVLSGEARRSYHGVPRVLDVEPLPAGLVAAIERRCGKRGGEEGRGAGGGEEGAGEEEVLRRAVHEATRGWRVNISVRCIS